MAPTLEDRVRNLERFRYATLGRVNACQTLIINALLDLTVRHSPDPVAMAEQMQAVWLEAARAARGSFAGIDPAHLDLVSQEEQQAMQQLSDQFVAAVRKAVSRSGKPER